MIMKKDKIVDDFLVKTERKKPPKNDEDMKNDSNKHKARNN